MDEPKTETVVEADLTAPRLESIYDLPEEYRALQGVRLSDEQGQSIADRAYELMDGDQLKFSASLGKAKAEFIAAHKPVGDVWAKKEVTNNGATA